MTRALILGILIGCAISFASGVWFVWSGGFEAAYVDFVLTQMEYAK